ncbi:MAG: 8-oxo-dGTP diphosphatase [Desulfobulbaceae bacterium]|nr:8-oxo-dGTP diphosphatase [Desulfobulbaceae bacterium]
MSPYSPIVATLGFILSPDRTHTLLVHRNAREEDLHLGKFNGLGGKMRSNESIVDCMRREIREEAGIECLEIRLRGTVNWTEFGKNGEDWLGFIFRIDRFSGTPFSENPEGPLDWHPIDSLGNLPMWPGDRYFLPLVFDDNPAQFHGWMPYKDGQPQSWHFERF